MVLALYYLSLPEIITSQPLALPLSFITAFIMELAANLTGMFDNNVSHTAYSFIPQSSSSLSSSSSLPSLSPDSRNYSMIKHGQGSVNNNNNNSKQNVTMGTIVHEQQSFNNQYQQSQQQQYQQSQQQQQSQRQPPERITMKFFLDVLLSIEQTGIEPRDALDDGSDADKTHTMKGQLTKQEQIERKTDSMNACANVWIEKLRDKVLKKEKEVRYAKFHSDRYNYNLVILGIVKK